MALGYGPSKANDVAWAEFEFDTSGIGGAIPGERKRKLKVGSKREISQLRFKKLFELR